MDLTTVTAFAITVAAIGLFILVREIQRHGAPATPVRAVAVVNRHALADESEAADHLRGLRIVADNGAWAAWTTTPQRVLDDRTAELVVDPGLKPREVAEMVEHVEHGAGSVASVAALTEDTSLRGPMATAALEAAEVAAYDEAEERATNAFFAEFRGRLGLALEAFRGATGRVDRWVFYTHEDVSHCPRCAEAMHEISEEHRRIVGEHDTQAWDVRELRAILATA